MSKYHTNKWTPNIESASSVPAVKVNTTVNTWNEQQRQRQTGRLNNPNCFSSTSLHPLNNQPAWSNAAHPKPSRRLTLPTHLTPTYSATGTPPSPPNPLHRVNHRQDDQSLPHLPSLPLQRQQYSNPHLPRHALHIAM